MDLAKTCCGKITSSDELMSVHAPSTDTRYSMPIPGTGLTLVSMPMPADLLGSSR